MTRMWMVRGDGGSLYDAFRGGNVAAIGWNSLAQQAISGISRKQLIALYQADEPQARPGTAISGASQVWRFVNEIQNGDWIITYSPANRLYQVGKVTGVSEHHPELADQGMSLTRAVQWQPREVSRDSLSTSTKNSLGSTPPFFSSAAASPIASIAAAITAQ